jgi:hypothetical protein
MARSGCVYGSSGSFKTSQIKRLARWIAETTGKRTLLLSTDGGGWEPCKPEVDAGMIRPYRVEANVLPLILLRKISQGYWPENPEETSPENINLLPIDWTDVGAVAVEGWTSISQAVMRYLPDKGISVGGENRNAPGSNMSFALPLHVNGQVINESFGSSTRGDYGFTQNFIYSLVTNFNSLPCEYVLYTALESKTEDDDRSTVYGPAIAGKKATSQCGAWVGDLIHAQDYQVPRTIQVPNPTPGGDPLAQTVFDVTVRYFYKKHPDPATGILFPAKPRVTPEAMAELEARFPGGFFEPRADGSEGFDEYLRVVDRLAAGQADTLRSWREKWDSKLGRGAATAK